MTLRPRILTLLVLAALTGPAAAARADDTGTGGAQPTTPPQAPVVPGGLLGGQVQWQGTVAQGTQSAAVQRLDPASGSWTTIVTVPVAADGSFTASWLGDALGSYTVRAVPADGSQQQASTADAPPTARVTVFRGAKATWYGPGLFGKRTACGQRLTRSLVGVAHRRLPCGTPVEIYYAGHALVVPVVDRGPFANGASYDLTQAAAQALGFTATDRIGVVPRATAAPARKR